MHRSARLHQNELRRPEASPRSLASPSCVNDMSGPPLACSSDDWSFFFNVALMINDLISTAHA